MSGRLTRERFDRLLLAFDPDRNTAAESYELLRLWLVKFFAWEGARAPEDWADEVLDRVAARLLDGEAIANVTAYASGVARLALKEALRKQDRERPGLVELPVLQPEIPDGRAAGCLTRCLASLPPESRSFILEYYNGDAAERIATRHRMADRLGISMNSLRNRALRLRDRLEACLNSCLDGRDTSLLSDTSDQGGSE